MSQIGERYSTLNGEHEYTEKKYNETINQLMASYSGAPFNKYKLLDDAYRANGMFETGDALIPHPRETAEKYTRRKNMSYFINYVKPIVDANINLIFKNEPVRQNISSTYNLFLSDVDGNGTSLTRFMKKAAIRAKLHGVEFIVIDAPRIDETIVVTKKKFIDDRLYPYLYLVSPANIEDYVVDKFGRLVYIKYSVENDTIDSEGNKKTMFETWTLTKDFCIKSYDGNTEKFDNTIGIIPMIPVYGTINNSDDLIPQSDMYAIARTNLALFNACSEWREITRNQAFNLLVYPVGEDDDYEAVDSLNIGTSDLLLYRNGSQKPEWICPNTHASDMISNEISMLIKEIYRMANMQFTQQQYVSNVSGAAMQMMNQQLYQSLTELANGLQEVEKKIAKIFGLYVGENLDNISVVYNKNFSVTDASSVLANATASLAMNICEGFNIEVKKQVIRSVLQDVDNSVVAEVINDLEKNPEKGTGIEAGTIKTVQPTAV